MKEMLLANKRVAIVGGGPGGLTLARLLQMKGANVQVYERDASRNIRVQGATLDLHEASGLRALQVAGLMEAFQAAYRPGADRLTITDKYAQPVAVENGSNEDQTSRPEIDRGPLRDLLLDALQVGTIVWDSQLATLEQQGNFIRLYFKNGISVEADVVIAADGANSTIRPYITSIKPFYSGITVVEGTVYHSEKRTPVIHQLLNGGKIFALGDDKTLIISLKGDGSLVFYTGCKTTENWAKETGIDFSEQTQALAWFKKVFKSWSTIWDELFKHTALPLMIRPQYCMPLDQVWQALPNLTMLGDAAHLMPPYAGEGVNMAMLDALELAECLTSEALADIPTAIIAYEQAMRARASEIAAITLEQTAALHSPDAIAHLLAIIRPNQ